MPDFPIKRWYHFAPLPSRYPSTDLISYFIFVSEDKQLNIDCREICISFSVNYLFMFFAYFSIELLDFSQFLEVLRETSPFFVIWAENTFLSLSSSFDFYVVFATKKFFTNVVVFVFFYGFWILNHKEKGFPHSVFVKLSIVFLFSCTSIVLFFTFKSLMHLEFTLLYGLRY